MRHYNNISIDYIFFQDKSQLIVKLDCMNSAKSDQTVFTKKERMKYDGRYFSNFLTL